MKNKNIQNEVLGKIVSGKVRMHSQCWFLLKTLVLLSLFWVSLLGVAVLGGLWNYIREINEEMSIVDVPFWSVVAAVWFLVIGVWFYGKIGINYKKGFGIKLAILLGLILVLMVLIITLEKMYLLELLMWNLGD